MRTHSRPFGGNLGKALAAVLVLALMAPGLSAGQRRGNDVIVTKTDGKVVAGELLAVRGTELIIMDGSTTEGVTAGLADVRNVRVIKGSKFLKGVGLGLLIGAPAGALLGAATGKKNPGWFEYTAGEGAVVGGVFFGALGALTGGIVGALSGIDKTVTVTSTSPGWLSQVAYDLRKYARDRS